jgi:hypothetical protein
MTQDDIYQRQQELDLEPPHTVTVIGVGGVGSWVALDLALAGVQKIYLVDHDHIETHNLNRTPFKEEQIEKDKVTALTELISERRIEAEPVPITERIEQLAGTFRDEIKSNPIIDCRDSADPLGDDLDEQVVLTAGYDGFEFTLHTNPDYDQIWGDEDTEYETVPSFIAPPQFLSSIVTSIVCSPELRTEEEQYTTHDMREVIRDLLGGGDNPTPYTPDAYAQNLAEEVEGDEGEYTIELKELAEEMAETIDSDTAEGMLEAALDRARGDE